MHMILEYKKAKVRDRLMMIWFAATKVRCGVECVLSIAKMCDVLRVVCVAVTGAHVARAMGGALSRGVRESTHAHDGV